MAKEQLIPKSDNISEWYTEVIKLADLADYGPVKGTMIIKPYGYGIWEQMQQALDSKIKDRGVDNAYFPLFIPMSFIEKEQSHVDGFAPELAVVTHAGGEKLEEALVVRPTSETIIYNSYAKWIQSWRDLPVMMNQWCNVVRWEKRTSPFLRTSEFLWQEGHTAHETHEEASAMVEWAMDSYASIYRDYLAIDGYVGYKSASERFAGADRTLTYEALMPSGKALQSCTSHDLGQNFSKVFDISFQSRDKDSEFVWQTSWGFSTRSIGGLILMHGDDNGLRLPPKIAPTQVVIVPAKLTDEVIAYGNQIMEHLKQRSIRTVFDIRDDETFGYKLNKWEVKGVPIVLKVGPHEESDKTLTFRRRDTFDEGTFQFNELHVSIETLLGEIQDNLFTYSRDLKLKNTRQAQSYEEFKNILATHQGFIKVCWNDDADIEKKIKEETKATSRCCLLNSQVGGVDFYSGKPADKVWIFSHSY